MNESTIARFWSKVDKAGPVPIHAPELGPCWVWRAGLSPDGYGKVKVHQKTWRAHRFSWLLCFGDAGGCILHRCDNRRCVRPEHLFPGTTADNTRDMLAKGREARGLRNGKYTHPERTPRGERNGCARLTAHQVRAIRAARGSTSQRALARQYGVAQSTIGAILRQEKWVHI